MLLSASAFHLHTHSGLFIFIVVVFNTESQRVEARNFGHYNVFVLQKLLIVLVRIEIFEEDDEFVPVSAQDVADRLRLGWVRHEHLEYMERLNLDATRGVAKEIHHELQIIRVGDETHHHLDIVSVQKHLSEQLERLAPRDVVTTLEQNRVGTEKLLIIGVEPLRCHRVRMPREKLTKCAKRVRRDLKCRQLDKCEKLAEIFAVQDATAERLTTRAFSQHIAGAHRRLGVIVSEEQRIKETCVVIEVLDRNKSAARKEDDVRQSK